MAFSVAEANEHPAAAAERRTPAPPSRCSSPPRSGTWCSPLRHQLRRSAGSSAGWRWPGDRRPAVRTAPWRRSTTAGPGPAPDPRRQRRRRRPGGRRAGGRDPAAGGDRAVPAASSGSRSPAPGCSASCSGGWGPPCGPPGVALVLALVLGVVLAAGRLSERWRPPAGERRRRGVLPGAAAGAADLLRLPRPARARHRDRRLRGPGDRPDALQRLGPGRDLPGRHQRRAREARSRRPTASGCARAP